MPFQKFRLTWNDQDARVTPRARVEFAEAPEREGSPVRCLDAEVSICVEPRCHCFDILFEWLPAAEDATAEDSSAVHCCWFSLKDNLIVLDPKLEPAPEALRVGEIIRTEISEAERQRLREWFLVSKLKLIESTPPEEIEIRNLPNTEDGAMVGFTDVFPFGSALRFRFNDQMWAVDEQYCVRHECTCQESVLTFLKLANASGQKFAIPDGHPEIRYNYASGGIKQVQIGPRSRLGLSDTSLHKQLVEALLDEHPDLNVDLAHRHRILQLLYVRQKLERSQSRLELLEANQASRNVKIGRNDLCTCGSGRKYKQCCLNKPS